MKRFYFIFSLLISFSIGHVWAETVEFTPSNCTSWTGSQAAQSQTISGITISSTGAANSTQLRLYANYTHTFTSTVGNITSIVFTCTANGTTNYGPGKLSGDGYTASSGKTGEWKGNAASVTISGGQARCTSIVVTYTPSGGSTEPTVCDDPTFSPKAGSYEGKQNVTISSTDGATIYYTTDGSEPTTSSYVYSAAIEVSADMTIKAFAVKEGLDDSQVSTAAYRITAGPDVTLNLVDGNWNFPGSDTQTLTKYTNSSTGYAVSCYATTAYKVSGSNYFIIGKSGSYILLPEFSYPVEKIVVVGNNSGSGSVIFNIYDGENAASTAATGCTTDKTFEIENPKSDNQYSVKVTNAYNLQLKAIKIYFGDAPAVAKPTIEGTDNFLTSTTVTISHDDADHIYYTTNGDAPTTSSTEYTAPFSLTETSKVKAIAVKGTDESDVAEKTFTKATILTPSEALTIINGWSTNKTSIEDYYVAGTISQIDAVNENSFATYYISNDGTTSNQLQVYKGLWVNGANFTSTNQIQLGDDVTVKGKLKKYNSYKELDQNNEIVAYKLKARISWSENSYEADMSGSNTFPTLTNTNGVAVTYSSSNTSAATISNEAGHEGEITLVAVGSTTIKATFAGNETYKANEVSYILNVANSVVRADISFEENGGSAVADLTQQTNLPDQLPTTTKAGYNFGGWYMDSEFNTSAVAGDAIDEDKTLYAKWLDPYTVAEAKTVIDGLNGGTKDNQYVAGIISQIDSYSSNYKSITYWISADGTTDDQLEVYSGLIGNAATALNKQQFSAMTDLKLGDTVVVVGTLKKYNDIYEFDKNNTIYSFSRKEDAELAWSAEEFTAYIGEENTFPTLTNDHNVTVSYSSSETSYATINASTGSISLVAEGTTVIKATFAGDETYRAAEVSYTLQVHPAIVHAKITYVLNGGSVVDNVEDATALPSPLPTPTKENSVFDGWYTDAQFNTPAVAGASLTGDITLYAKWSEIPVWAYTYTSNVDIASNEEKQVTIGEEDYDAAKTNKGTSATITLPQGVTAIHLHLVAWKGEAQTVSVTGACFNAAKELTILANDAVSGTAAKYDLGASGVDYYCSLTPDKAVAENEVITITAASNKRFVLFGVNQEGGVLPVLDHIAITGTMSNTTGWKTGDEITPEGLTVNAYYTLNEVEQAPVDVTASVVWSHASLVENQTEVTLTATYTENEVVKTANVNVTIDAVETGDPTIITDPASYLNFGSSVVQDAVVASKTITVTLKNITNATATLGGTNYSAFSIDDTEIVDGDVITVSVNTSTTGVYAGTVTIKDNNSETEKVIALSMTVVEPEVPETAVSTTSQWVAAEYADLVDGKEVLIVGVNSTTSKVYAAGEQGSNNRAAVEASVDGEGVLTPGANTMSFTLVAQEGGTFALRTSKGEYLYAASSSKNYLRSQATIDDNAKWTLTVTSASAEASSNNHVMQFNSGSSLFSCYASASQSAIKLYVPKPAPAPAPKYSVTYDANGGSGDAPAAVEYEEGETFEVAAANLFTVPQGKEFDKWNDGTKDYAPGDIYTVGTSDVVLKAIWIDAQPEPQDPEEDWTDGIRTGLTIGNYYTMCLNKAVTNVRGASIWRIVSKTADNNGIILEEVTTLAAGRPYLFCATAASMDVVYTGDAVSDPVNDANNNGLVGSFVQTQIENVATNYILYNNALYFVNSDNVYVGANRAYLDITGVPPYNNGDEPQVGNSPRRRVTMSVHGQNVATDVDAISVSEKPMKLMIDGQLFILRGEKMYDATGRLVK